MLAEAIAFGHGPKEQLDLAIEAGDVPPAVLDHARKQVGGQQVDVFGEEAEQQADQIVGDVVRLIPPLGEV